MYLNLTFYQANLFDSNEKYSVREAKAYFFFNLKFWKCVAGLMGNVLKLNILKPVNNVIMDNGTNVKFYIW